MTNKGRTPIMTTTVMTRPMAGACVQPTGHVAAVPNARPASLGFGGGEGRGTGWLAGKTTRTAQCRRVDGSAHCPGQRAGAVAADRLHAHGGVAEDQGAVPTVLALH